VGERGGKGVQVAYVPIPLAVKGWSEGTLSHRPGAKNWAPTEVICHLRDNEELFLTRLRLIMLANEPYFLTTSPDGEAEDRQYLRNDPFHALQTFARRREATILFYRELEPAHWERVGIHVDSRGRRSIDEFLTVIAWYDDDNHLDQLRRAGRR
jgi:hypothetical protein